MKKNVKYHPLTIFKWKCDYNFVLVLEAEDKAIQDGRIGGDTVLVDISTQCGTMNSLGVERMEVPYTILILYYYHRYHIDTILL